MNLLALCERFGQLPSAVLAEDSGFLQLLQLEALVREARGDNDVDED